MKNIISLFKHLSNINRAYEIVKKSTNEDFNIFSILRMETDEVNTHSRFIAELLNPKGSHFQEEKFLELFIKYFNYLKKTEDNSNFLGAPIELNPRKSIIEVEKYIAPKTEKEGGRLDIAISEGRENFICIENKIYAGEQENQMERYYNYAKKAAKQHHIFFLTLFGDKPSSVYSEDCIIYNISYKKHIVEWLELCKKEVADNAIIRETINQYINLIKKLTYQTINKEMEKDIQDLILKNYSESSLIYKSFEKAIYSPINTIIENLSHKISSYLQNQNSKWHVFHTGTLNSLSDRGRIFIKPKFFNDNGSIAIEEFNPLTTAQHFGHRVFYGLFNKNPNLQIPFPMSYPENKKDGWLNYEFCPIFEGIELKTDEDNFIDLLTNETKMQELTEHLYESFIQYFEKYAEDYLNFLNGEQLDLDNFLNNSIKKLNNINLHEIYCIFENRFNISNYKNVTEKWIYNNRCFVVDFNNRLACDLYIENEEMFLDCLHRDNEDIKYLIPTNYEIRSDTRYRFFLKGETLAQKFKDFEDNYINFIDNKIV